MLENSMSNYFIIGQAALLNETEEMGIYFQGNQAEP
jgi:hypothetical protein